MRVMNTEDVRSPGDHWFTVAYSAHLRAGVAPDCDVVAYEEEGESALHGAPGRVSDDEDDEEESELH